MGRRNPPAPVRRAVRLTPQMAEDGRRLSIFPLSGAILYPGLLLPLHIFEPRYRAMVSDAIARDRMIAMIQPKGEAEEELYSVGCVGYMREVEALEDGRYNIILEGRQRFTILRELPVATPFRQVEARLWDEAEEDEILASAERAALEAEARHFAERLGYHVEWDNVARLDDYALVCGMAQIAPFDSPAKQALLECRGLSERSELLIQLMQFFGSGDSEGPATLQ